MASITQAQILAIVKNWAKSEKGSLDAMTVIEADLVAQKTRYDSVTDDEGISHELAALTLSQPNVLDALALPVRKFEMERLAAYFAVAERTPTGADTTTVYDSFDDWWTGEHPATNDGLIANEVARAWRFLHGQGSLSAANCAAPTATSYGTFTITAAAAGTLVAVSDPVDTDLYTGGPLELIITTQVEGLTGAAVTGTITGTDINGSAWTGTYSIPDASIIGALVDVTPTIAGSFPVEITACTVANAEAPFGAFTIRIKQPYTYSQ